MGIGRGILVVSLALAVAGYWVKSHYYPEFTYRYKLYLTIKTPSGQIEKSNTSEVNISFPLFNILAPTSYKTNHIGDAFFIDLGAGKSIILIELQQNGFDRKDTWRNLPFYAAIPKISLNKRRIPSEIKLAKEAGKLEVPLKELPMTIILRRINDPETIAEIDPLKLSAYLGSGYAVTGAMIELTDEPVTRGLIELKLPWLRDLPRNARISSRYALYSHDFKAEEK